MVAVPPLTHLAFFQDDMEAYRTQNRFLNSEIHQVTKIWRKVAEKEKALLTKVQGVDGHIRVPPLPAPCLPTSTSLISQACHSCGGRFAEGRHGIRSGLESLPQIPAALKTRHRKLSVKGKRWTGKNQEERKARGSPEGWIEVSIDAYKWPWAGL